MANIVAAAQRLGDRSFSDAVEQLKTPGGISAAEQLINELAQIHLQQFDQIVGRFQDSTDSAEVDALRRQISTELFGELMPRIRWSALPSRAFGPGMLSGSIPAIDCWTTIRMKHHNRVWKFLCRRPQMILA